jgi:hypothetical protein
MSMKEGHQGRGGCQGGKDVKEGLKQRLKEGGKDDEGRKIKGKGDEGWKER